MRFSQFFRAGLLAALCLAAAALSARATEAGTTPPWLVELESPGQEGPLAQGVLLNGSGVVVAPSSALPRSGRVRARLPDGQTRPAEVLTRADAHGLTLLRVGPVALPELPTPHEGPAPARGARLSALVGTGRGKTAVVLASADDAWAVETDDAAAAVLGAVLVDGRGTVMGINLGRTSTERAGFSRIQVMPAARLWALAQTLAGAERVGLLCVTSDVPGARAALDGDDLGELPARFTEVPAGWHTLTVSAPGYQARSVPVRVLLTAAACQELSLPPAVSLYLKADQPGAQVSVNGAPWVPLTVRPITLPVGAHLLRVRARGFRTAELTLEPSAAGVVEQAVTLSREHGRLSVTTDPPGAQVLVQGHLAGVTPLSEARIAPGTWEVELRLFRHKPVLVNKVSIRDDETTNLGTLALAPVPGRLSLKPGTREDGDQVWLDGRRVAGQSWRVEAGVHEVELRRPWHLPVRARVTAAPDEERQVVLEPEPAPAGRERRIKLMAGVAALVHAVSAVLTGASLGASALALLVGARLSYDRYHQSLQPADMTVWYRAANLLLWVGVASAVVSALPCTTAAASLLLGGLVLFTLPSDPSTRTPPPAPGAGAPAEVSP